MRVLNDLEPKKVFSYFEDICGIPHPSYHEKEISDYLVAFAKEHHLEYYQDDLYNVIIIKEATKGYEDVAPILLQGHMDMVAEQTKDCKKDMEKEGLDLAIDGDFIMASQTTLGGDDGIAVAYALAILDDDTLSHPRLEVLITVSEEVGMEGAAGVDVSHLTAKKLLNIDNEEEGVILVGCAGGCRSNVALPVERETVSGSHVEITISGLLGGHSGSEIAKGKANADVLMGRLLREAASVTDIRLMEFSGGKKDNAIPRECTAKIVVPADDAAEVLSWLSEEVTHIQREYEISDPNVTIAISDAGTGEADALCEEDTSRVIALLQAHPNGVMAMSASIDGLVETSLNIGICSLKEKEFILRSSVRSSVNSAKEDLMARICCIAECLDAEVTFDGLYPAWEYKKDSKLRADAKEVYEEMFHVTPRIEAIHAGLECGLLSGKIADLDAISIGPDMFDIHTTEERLSISSTQRMYAYVVELIARK